jgi:hypothetical protein
LRYQIGTSKAAGHVVRSESLTTDHGHFPNLLNFAAFFLDLEQCGHQTIGQSLSSFAEVCAVDNDQVLLVLANHPDGSIRHYHLLISKEPNLEMFWSSETPRFQSQATSSSFRSPPSALRPGQCERGLFRTQLIAEAVFQAADHGGFGVARRGGSGFVAHLQPPELLVPPTGSLSITIYRLMCYQHSIQRE